MIATTTTTTTTRGKLTTRGRRCGGSSYRWNISDEPTTTAEEGGATTACLVSNAKLLRQSHGGIWFLMTWRKKELSISARGLGFVKSVKDEFYATPNA